MEEALYSTSDRTRRIRALNLRAIVQNYLTDNGKGRHQLITWFLNDMMKEDVAQQAMVPGYVRSGARRAHRNGYRHWSLKTLYGELTLLRPRLRAIPFETTIFAKYARTENALVNATVES